MIFFIPGDDSAKHWENVGQTWHILERRSFKAAQGGVWTVLVSMVTNQASLWFSGLNLSLPQPDYLAALLLIILMVVKELMLSGVNTERDLDRRISLAKSRMLTVPIAPLLFIFCWMLFNEALKLV